MKLLSALILDDEITDVERLHVERVNRIAFAFFAAHVPAFTLLAWLNGTRPLAALGLTTALLIGPAIAHRVLGSPRAIAIVYGVTAMLMGGLLVHFGQGPVQIEMHFYFFALIAMLAVYGNPLVILAAAGTVALHHLLLWLVAPPSVFNYDAPVWVVAVHAAFVVLESAAACFIARSFFDNVIGLERIVRARTTELDASTRDMRLLLDNINQGIFTVDNSGRISSQRSAALERWFGPVPSGSTVGGYFEAIAPSFGISTRIAWDQVAEALLPREVSLGQMPTALVVGSRQYAVSYSAIGDADAADRFLVVVSDITSEVERQAFERELRETMGMFQHLLADRSGFLEFVDEATALVEAISSRRLDRDLAQRARALHTLKGTCAIFGLRSVADLCHALETSVDEGAISEELNFQPLSERWAKMVAEANKLAGARGRVIEVTPEQHATLEAAIAARASLIDIAMVVHDLKLEPTRLRLQHFAEQAKRIAARLGKGDIAVEVRDHGLRLPTKEWQGFWAALVHAVRNAVDHGLETPEERSRGGKRAVGTLTLVTQVVEGMFVVEVTDDGRGIEWERLRARAQSLSIPCDTQAALRELLFQDGVSTAAEVTELAGRGVGMGALRQAVEERCGSILVESDPGKGTRLRMLFPSHTMDPELPELLRALMVASGHTSGAPACA